MFVDSDDVVRPRPSRLRLGSCEGEHDAFHGVTRGERGRDCVCVKQGKEGGGRWGWDCLLEEMEDHRNQCSRSRRRTGKDLPESGIIFVFATTKLQCRLRLDSRDHSSEHDAFHGVTRGRKGKRLCLCRRKSKDKQGKEVGGGGIGIVC